MIWFIALAIFAFFTYRVIYRHLEEREKTQWRAQLWQKTADSIKETDAKNLQRKLDWPRTVLHARQRLEEALAPRQQGLASVFLPQPFLSFDSYFPALISETGTVVDVEAQYTAALKAAQQSLVYIPEATRFAGTWIAAPSGRGKTNLLHHMIAYDRKQKATIVLMDSKGDMINAYKGFEGVVVIDPATAHINPLQLGSSTRTVEFLEYIFSALLETTMTSLQKTLFRSVLTILLKVPNATLETFRQVLTVGWRPLNLEPYIRQCDRATQDFFLEGKRPEFDGNTYVETKQQILWRLRLILSNDYLRSIFTSPTTNVPFSELLDSGKLIIIDNSKDDLGEEGAEFFGRFFVALTWMAAVSRSRLAERDKVPVYFYIDECHSVIKRDTKITTILDECRSQKIALILAHQRVGQINPEVMDALNNCAIRLANSDDDAEALAKRFRVDASQLRLPQGSFACFVRDQTAQARTVSVSLFDTSQFPPPPAKAPTPKPPPRPTPREEAPARPAPGVVPREPLDFG